MADVTLEQVRKVYDNGHVAVEEATFEVADGELLVMVGPSGCGKSTLLRMIAGLETITAGELRIGGRRVNEVAPKERDIAMVFQSYALYPHMTVAENLGFALRLRSVPKAEVQRRVRQVASTLELDGVLDRRPAALSGGQRQRVALGRALVREPQVFLLDEPLSNLDARLRAGTRVEIARLHRQIGATMIYVTHDQIEAMTLGQRIVVLREGRIQQIDAPMALYERPANLFVATFLGSPSMNVLRGRLVREDGLKLRLADGQAVPLPAEGRIPERLVGGEVALGFRPEHLRLAPDGPFRAELELVEPVGNEIFLNLRLGAQALVSRTPPGDAPASGDAVGLTLDPTGLHLFDPVSGDRLTP